MAAPQRFHLIGGPGSGKTTLARRLGAAHGCPVIDLDQVGYDEAGGKRPLSDRLGEVSRIAAGQGWVSEGIFLGWTAELLERADVIVWLDPPWRVAAWRIIKRHALASWRGTNRHRGLRLLWSFLGFARRYYLAPAVPAAPDDDAGVTRAATVAALRDHEVKVIHCRRGSVDRLLSKLRMSTGAAATEPTDPPGSSVS